jgi:hypothetical protein
LCDPSCVDLKALCGSWGDGVGHIVCGACGGSMAGVVTAIIAFECSACCPCACDGGFSASGGTGVICNTLLATGVDGEYRGVT